MITRLNDTRGISLVMEVITSHERSIRIKTVMGCFKNSKEIFFPRSSFMKKKTESKTQMSSDGALILVSPVIFSGTDRGIMKASPYNKSCLYLTTNTVASNVSKAIKTTVTRLLRL
jgi:hypothetical protein